MIASNQEPDIRVPLFPSIATKMLAPDREIVDDAKFCAYSTLVLRARGDGTTFQLSCQHLDTGTILGRSINTDDAQQYIDLTPLNGEGLGVSRLHTYLCFDPETQAILVIDLGSMNGTFINGARLGNNEVRVLRHGDKLQLGKLEFGITILNAMTELEIS